MDAGDVVFRFTLTQKEKTMKFSAAFCLSLFLLTAAALPAAENDAPLTEGDHIGAVDLLRGATLDDFDFFLLDGGQRDDVFSLNGGVLTISGTPFGWLGTKNDYHNFVVETEFRLLEPEGETNSGFLVRMGEQKPTKFLPHCVEIGIYDKETGTLFGFHDFRIMGEKERMVRYENHEDAGNCDEIDLIRDPITDLGEWNKMKITCLANVIMVELNGVPVNWGVMAEDYAGKIAFQSEGAKIEFRNAFLTEMP